MIRSTPWLAGAVVAAGSWVQRIVLVLVWGGLVLALMSDLRIVSRDAIPGDASIRLELEAVLDGIPAPQLRPDGTLSA